MPSATNNLHLTADFMTHHTDWRLAVTALVKSYHSNAGRLQSAGFGKSQAKDSNDALEGRARDGRVELMRF